MVGPVRAHRKGSRGHRFAWEKARERGDAELTSVKSGAKAARFVGLRVADHGGSGVRSAAFSERCEWEKERGRSGLVGGTTAQARDRFKCSRDVGERGGRGTLGKWGAGLWSVVQRLHERESRRERLQGGR